MRGLIHSIAGSPGKIAPLDGIRAFAILFVLCRHALVSFNNRFTYNSFDGSLLSNFLLNGWVGVDLFFVLSGFLIGYHLLNSWAEGEGRRIAYLGSYWLKRILRTFPVYYFVLLIIITELVPMYQYTSKNIGDDLFIHIAFLQDYYGSNFLVPMWSLATEEKFYLFCPVLIWIMYKFLNSPSVLYFSLMLLACLPLVFRLNTLSVYFASNYLDFFWTVRAPFHMALDGLLMGLIVSLFIFRTPNIDGIKKWSNKALMVVVICFVSLMCAFEWFSGKQNWYLVSVFIFLLSIIFALTILFSVNCTGKIYCFLSSIFLRFISRISYSLYLIHMLVIPMSIYASGLIVNEEHNRLLVLIVYFSIYAILSISISVFVHLLVERPFLNLKSKIKYKR